MTPAPAVPVWESDSFTSYRLWRGFMAARVGIGLVLLFLLASLMMLGLAPSVDRWQVGLCGAYLAAALTARFFTRPAMPGVAFDPHVPEIAGVIQLAIAPVFMLTAVGMVIGALNIRLGRAVDRRRELEERVPSMAQAELPSAQEELATIARRIRFVYLSIVFAVVSALFIALLIAGAFVGAFVRTDLSLTIAAMFISAMLALIVCLLLFLKEIFLAVSTPRHVPR